MSDPFQYTITLSRGTEADDRDKQKVKVSAETIEQLDQRVQAVKSKLEEWAGDYREIQPQEGRITSEDQSELGAIET